MIEDIDSPSQAVAVIGMAGRFPGADDVAGFWANISAGVESVTIASPEELASSGIPESVYAHPSYVPAKGRLGGIDLFDAEFFGYSAHEAELTDPQHRLFLESAWAALEDAGHDPARFAGRIGVYAGQTVNTYLLYQAMRNPALIRSFYLDYMPMLIPANDDFLATRVAYKLDLHGPAMTVQTACSSSLVAIHQACQSLLYGECDLVLAGGVGLTVPEEFGHIHREGAGLSPDGHCRAFDEATSGIVGGCGLGVVVLRRLADAVRDGDTVHAVVLGSAVNNDGARKAGFATPSVAGQAQVIADALAVANVSADSVHLVEAHGTATTVGDAVEVAALTRAFRADTDRVGYCHLGSVKTNVGHLGAAAGVTSFLKAALAVRDGVVPGTLHFRRADPKLSLDSSPFVVRADSTAWPQHDGPRRAGVTSLGIGGTNAHVVLEQPPAPDRPAESREWQLLLVSGRTPVAVRTAAERLARALPDRALPDRALPDAAYTLQVGRRPFEFRQAVVCRDAAGAMAALSAPATPRRAVPRRVALLFPGAGAQYAGMGRSLYAAEPIFHEYVDRCAELAGPGLGYDLREVLLGRDEGRLAEPPGMLMALFTVDYALAQLWRHWGLEPVAMLGHSLGEYVAACLAGVFDLAAAISAVLARAHLMAELPAAAMLSVTLPEAELIPLLGAELSLSAVNGPRQCTVSGPAPAVESLAARLGERGVDVRRVRVRQPAHAREMDPVLDRFEEHLRGLTLHPPRERFLSNVTGTWITDAEATDPRYWVRHLRQTVRFAEAVRTLLEIPHLAILEVGPGTTLGSLVAANLSPDAAEVPVVSSLPHPRDPQPEQRFLLSALGRLWSEGVDVDWAAFSAGERRRRVPLPTYPFERRRYWIDPPEPAAPPAAAEHAEASVEADFGSSRHARPDLLTAYATPDGEAEQAVAEIWQELLGFDRIGAEDNFYALGGSSLLAMRLLSRLRERFGVEPDLEAFLAVHTIRDQALVLRELLTGSPS